MLELIKEFPAQLLTALEIGEKSELKTKFNIPVRNVVVAGLGGSGIGGNLMSELLREELSVPVIVSKSYFLPAFIDASTLLILCSYSGNTEETIACATQAIEKKIRPVIITSGGELEKLAVQHQFDLIKIPGGFPPRACLGYSVTQLFFVLKHVGLINDTFETKLQKTAIFLKQTQEKIKQATKLLAAEISNKIVIVYAEDKYESVALRLKQQINENSKMQCWYNVIPEMNHNELVGWRAQNNSLAVIMLRSDDEFYRNTQRTLFSKEIINKKSDFVFEIYANGEDTFEKHFFFIHFADWLSYNLAVEQGYDPSEIEVLNKLKSHMSDVK